MGLITKNLVKDFGSQRVLHGLDITIDDGEFVSISGRSGSGKSTLLYLLSTLDLPSEGQVIIDDLETTTVKMSRLDEFRALHIGFIFQFHYLLPELTALENILLPARNLGVMSQKQARAEQLLAKLEISEQAHKLPSKMSGGQMQRVAIARALIMEPKYIFADEPTGNLDTHNAEKVMDMLIEINQEQETTVVLVTHEPDFSKMAQREIFLIDGRLESQRSFTHSQPSAPA